MIKTYGVHDHWTDIAKKNDVDIMSEDGVITEIKVNGEAIGGGGSSDFSTAKVTVLSTKGRIISAGHIVTEDDDDYLMYAITEAGEYDVITYKGSALLMASIKVGETITVSGNAETSNSEIYITGDCTITIS